MPALRILPEAQLPGVLRCWKSLKLTVDQRDSYRISYTKLEFLMENKDKQNQNQLLLKE